jgi:SAM-dependent methyltransferase
VAEPTGPVDFDGRYREDPDPWGVHSRWYERRKTACLGAALARERYAVAWDAACGVGQVAALLADRCDLVVASDLSPRAVELTAAHTAGRVETVVSRLPAVPALAGDAELVVLAEVVYYLPPAERARLAEVLTSLPGATEVAAVSWRHEAEDTWGSGADSLAELGGLLTRSDWKEHTWLQDPSFEIRTWVRSPGSA